MKKGMLALTCFLLCSIAIWAKPPAPKGDVVSLVELHYNVHDVEANKKFWITLGATPVTIGNIEALKFPNALVFLTQAETTAGTDGSVINHVGFKVSDLAQTAAKMKEAGYKATGNGPVGGTFTPENERIELLQEQTIHVYLFGDDGKQMDDPKMTVPIQMHHMHLYIPMGTQMDVKAWYVKNFGGIPGKRWKEEDHYHYETVILPKPLVELDLLEVPDKTAPTKGRRLDHIGFEVKDLKAFCKNLEANGVKLDVPYKKVAPGIATAYLTDPWGTYIELTEGMER
jgi:catechol 2,3-dioxygenase-like lactoylglutathione lyase family enzyme